VTQQAITVLVSEHLAPASEKPAESGAGWMIGWRSARSRSARCPTARSARMAASIGDGALPAYQRALGTLARSQMIARRAAP
jgi:hypothetical protein